MQMNIKAAAIPEAIPLIKKAFLSRLSYNLADIKKIAANAIMIKKSTPILLI